MNTIRRKFCEHNKEKVSFTKKITLEYFFFSSRRLFCEGKQKEKFPFFPKERKKQSIPVQFFSLQGGGFCERKRKKRTLKQGEKQSILKEFFFLSKRKKNR